MMQGKKGLLIFGVYIELGRQVLIKNKSLTRGGLKNVGTPVAEGKLLHRKHKYFWIHLQEKSYNYFLN